MGTLGGKLGFERAVRWLAHVSSRRPGLVLLATALVTLPALHEVRKIRLDTDLARLLPRDSRAVRAQRELEGLTGDGGYFSVLFESDARDRLPAAVDEAVARIQALPEVQSVESRNPLAFLQRYRYMLASSRQLGEALDRVERIEREVNPLVESLDDPAPAAGGGTSEGSEFDSAVKRYLDLPERHQSEDGRVMGLIVRPRRGVTSLGATRDLYGQLSAIANDVARKHACWGGVAGSLRSKVDTYDQILADLTRGGTVSTLGILTALVIGFRSLAALPVVLLPLAFGLTWSYALVPGLVGDLNTITSFLLMVLLGVGVEFAIHLVKRFQAELAERPVEDAVFETLRSTGRSILVSGFATTFGMAILVVSRFRGFSEFGVISGLSILAVFAAMFVVLPPAMVLGARWRMVRAHTLREASTRLLPGRWLTVALLALAAAAALAATRLSFDYDFSSLTSSSTSAAEAARERHRKVYQGFSAPSAIYVARDLVSLDGARAALEARRTSGSGEPIIGTITSVRDFVPDAREWAERQRLLGELKERVQGSWTRRVKDETTRRLLTDLAAFQPPADPPGLADLPPQLLSRLRTRDGSGFVLTVDTPGRSRDGLMAMAFTRTLYDTPMPEGVRGPTGDKPVLAEILWLVTSEGPWLVGATFLGVVLMVFADRRSLVQTFWVLLPLLCGLAFCLGGMLLFGWRFNFFNVIVLPNLIGNAVDNGVHYYRRWEETGHDSAGVQQELAGPLTVSVVTTAMGYAGMLVAHHAGLRAIASLATWGLFCCWFAGVTVMPGVLTLLAARARRRSPSRCPS